MCEAVWFSPLPADAWAAWIWREGAVATPELLMSFSARLLVMSASVLWKVACRAGGPVPVAAT